MDWKTKRGEVLRMIGTPKIAAEILGVTASNVCNLRLREPTSLERILILSLDEHGSPEEKIRAAAARLQALRGGSKERAAIAKLRAILKSLR